MRICRRSQIFRAKSFNCSVAISTATFLTQMAQNLCHSSPTKNWLHFVHASTLGFRAGLSRFERSVIGQPRPKLTCEKWPFLGVGPCRTLLLTVEQLSS